MKRFVSLVLCGVMLLSLSACTRYEKSPYRAALDAIEAGEYQRAYDLLQTSTDRRAPELLEKLLFVPVKTTERRSNGYEQTTTYTYDEWGRLLKRNAMVTTYTDSYEAYDEYTYSGILVTACWECYDDNYWGRTCTYDDRGNLLVQRQLDRNSDETEKTVYTYDEADHMLSWESDRNGSLTSAHYTYHDNGNLCTMEMDIDNGLWIEYYDEDGNFTESYRVVGEERQLMSQKRYDEAGREIYHRDADGIAVPLITETVYNEQGLVIETNEYAEDPEDGYFRTIQYTYDDAGNQLTYDEVQSDGFWVKRVYTYDGQGNKLTEKESYRDGWCDRTYTYNEAGQVLTKAWSQSQGKDPFTYTGKGTLTYAYDASGNPVSFEQISDSNDDESVILRTAEWKLRYYPDGIPDPVKNAIADVCVQYKP